MILEEFNLKVGNIRKYYMEYYQSHGTLSCIWIILWPSVDNQSDLFMYFLITSRYGQVATYCRNEQVSSSVSNVKGLELCEGWCLWCVINHLFQVSCSLIVPESCHVSVIKINGTILVLFWFSHGEPFIDPICYRSDTLTLWPLSTTFHDL